jgi:hypothetical protein
VYIWNERLLMLSRCKAPVNAIAKKAVSRSHCSRPSGVCSLGLIVALVHDKEAKAVEVLRSFDMGSLPIR